MVLTNAKHPILTYLNTVIVVCNINACQYYIYVRYTKNILMSLTLSQARLATNNSLFEDPFFFTIKVYGSYLWHSMVYKPYPIVYKEKNIEYMSTVLSKHFYY